MSPNNQRWIADANAALRARDYHGALCGYFQAIAEYPGFRSILSSNVRAAVTRIVAAPGASAVLPSAESSAFAIVKPALFDVVICVHNALEDVKNCVCSVLTESLGLCRIIIVDDGSDAPTRDFIESLRGLNFVTIIRREAAGGYTLAANAGMRASSAEYVVLLNSDTIVSAGWLEQIGAVFSRNESVGIVGPLSNTASWQSIPNIFNPAGDWADNPLPPGWSVNEYALCVAEAAKRVYPRVGFVNGFCFAIRGGVILDIGLFDEENFARGYGEENDFCLRAIDAGWDLAIADDCYVFHAQSKSYSHERRAQLSKAAGERLSMKHGDAAIVAGVNLTRYHPYLGYVRARASRFEEYVSVRAETRRKFSGLRVGFLLPAGGSGGGPNVVINEALALLKCGVSVSVINLSRNRAGFERGYPALALDVVYVDDESGVAELASQFDAFIATLFRTVYWLDCVSDREGLRLGYYIQDYEPDFFEAASESRLAAEYSYIHNSSIRLFTKTRWNRDMVRSRHNVLVDVVGISVDVDSFYPSSSFNGLGAIRVLAMVRFETPRRAPMATLEVLARVKARFGARVEIVIFGSDRLHPEIMGNPVWSTFTNLGVLSSAEMPGVMRSVDVFIDCSVYQAMGLTALEAMSSGVAVVGPNVGGMSEFVVHGENGLLSDTSRVDDVVAKVSMLIDEPDLMHRIRTNAVAAAGFHPSFAAYKIMESLFSGRD